MVNNKLGWWKFILFLCPKVIKNNNEHTIYIGEIYVKKNKVITFKNNSDNPINYGVNIYDEEGNYNGVDYGWMNKSEFIMPQNGYVKLILRYVDNRVINDSNIYALTNGTITMPRTIQEVNDSINNLKSEMVNKITKMRRLVQFL